MLTLLAGLVLIVAWVVFTFILKVGSGAVGLLLAAGATLVVRWWALKPPVGEPQ